MLIVWLYWSAFAVIMLWTLGVSWAWALNALPTTAESAVIIVAVSIICIIQSVALCLISQRASRKRQYRSAHDANGSSNQQNAVASNGAVIQKERASKECSNNNENDAEKSIAHATWMIFAATLVNVVVALFQWQSIHVQADLMATEQRPWVGLDDENPSLVTSPITFDEKTTAHITYAVVSRNYSTHAANHVASFGDLLVTEDIEDVRKQRSRNCRATYPPEFGQVLFPGRSKIAVRMESQWPKEGMKSKSEDGKLQAWMVGCILYDRGTSLTDPFSDFTFRLTDAQTGPAIRFVPSPGLSVGGKWQLFESSAR